MNPAALTERWFDTSGGMLGMSMTLNVVLLGICWYLLRLMIKASNEKTKILEDNMKEVKEIYNQVLEQTLDVTRAITELSTIIKKKGD